MKKCFLETSDNMQPGKKSKKNSISFSIFFCRAPEKLINTLKLIALFESKKTSKKNLTYLYFWVKTFIWVIFPKKTPQKCRLIFLSENGGGGIRVFLFSFVFYSSKIDQKLTKTNSNYDHKLSTILLIGYDNLN